MVGNGIWNADKTGTTRIKKAAQSQITVRTSSAKHAERRREWLVVMEHMYDIRYIIGILNK